jgi:hypothetical protein
MRVLVATVIATASLYAQGAGGVQFRDWTVPAANSKPHMACSELRSLTSYELSVLGASVIPAAGDVPEHCRVSILIAPEINVEVNLPSAWNGRLYMFGNGGFAGESFDAANRAANRARGLRYGFATAATDTGHSAASEPAASFAVNRQKLVDFAFRSLHVTTETARRIIHAYYSEDPSKSYYDGCSQGGRQGLMFAQRFPSDFDGIIVGAPGLDNTGVMLARAYAMQAIAAAPIPAAKLPILANRIYEQCDAKDGLKDGLIEDPRRCGFQPARDLPRCAGSDDAGCFTPPQISALERVYGDVMSQGKRVFPGWPVGSEVIGPNGQSGWIGETVNGNNGPGVWTRYGETFLRFMAFPEKDPEYPLSHFDIDKDWPRTAAVAQLLNATDPDLTAFQHHGGKILMYFGWADPQLNPMMGVEYYEKVAEKMGSSTSDFFRLFMVPGMFHCGGGVGTSVFDAATPLVNWVESGKAPAQIAASRVLEGKVVRTRPLCVYPQVARYKGSGSIDDAGNFSCVKP